MLTVIADKVYDKYIEINDKNEIKHLVNVYRYKIGDKIRAIDYNYEYITEIDQISKSEVILKIIEKNEDKYSLDVNIDLAIGILKNEKMKLLIQKLTELGVRNIIPLKTERVVVRIDEKKEKWDTIVKESMKQCRAIKRTNVELINEIKRLKYENYDIIIYAYENSISSVKLKDIINKDIKNILCIIGPEGGFSIDEIEYLKSKNAIEISLGNRILRAETAAISVVSTISNLI
ncbi:RsmE family RNA methyltransferase [Pseudostreptobacillus hongkongensis]|uniref:RsmE family RNA methyltransferase n=1 Tax=Pseudostreptobacillus hongkongensis TaxID=1162717 RepID=UPI00083609B3|nr:RsmE family RNA methyltransferase [Pseudostreptobacillus hongkongensis]